MKSLTSSIRRFLKRGEPTEALTLRAVLGRELTAILARRRRLRLPGPDPQLATGRAEDGAERASTPDLAWTAGLVGLCFSGGGIRSAAFNLGVLQRLAGYRLLRQIDYLSTVSGGGYIGSWLTALLHRTLTDPSKPYPDESGDFDRELRQRFERLEAGLAWSPGDSYRQKPGPASEHAAISFLRRYSNYLTPKLGIFSADTWSLIAIYVRNAVLNQLVLILFLAAILLVPRLLAVVLTWLEAGTLPVPVPAVLAALGLFVGSRAAWTLGRNLAGVDADGYEPDPAATDGVIRGIVVHVFLIGVLAAGLFGLASGTGWQQWLLAAVGGAAANAAIWSIAALGARFSPWQRRAVGSPWMVLIASAVLSGSVIGLALYGGALWLATIEYSGFRILLAPALLLSALLAGAILQIGIAGDSLGSHWREWLSRLGGLMGIVGVGWLTTGALVFFAPLLVDVLPEYLDLPLIAGWAATTLGGVYSGRNNAARASAGMARRLLMTAAPWVFIVGLLVLLSAAVQGTLHGVALLLPDSAAAVATAYAAYTAALSYWGELPWQPYSAWLAATESVTVVLLAFGISLAGMYLLSRRVGINSFSLHNMYANRLVRCFLGAANAAENPDRRENPFTRFSATDDFGLGAYETANGRLLALGNPRARPAAVPPDSTAAYPGPYQVINTALNLSKASNLAWQERKAGAFVLSPLFCGFDLPEQRQARLIAVDKRTFRPAGEYASRPRRLTLGEAVATSGAAASPSMGYHTTPALSFLLGLFNIRLGRWVPNPRAVPGSAADLWKTSGPSFALLHLLSEVFGMTSDASDFVYLSDGGHFENLGIYEMVRRRCRFVIACDSGADPAYSFEDLGNAIRKCRIDLGVEIDIDTREIARIDADRCNGAPCAVGKIRYPEGFVGVLLYIKSSRRPGMPSDVLQYARKSAAFPHESTADQFFSESQFESYRRLGHFIASEILEKAVEEVRRRAEATPSDAPIDMEQLFIRLEQAWYPPSAAVATHFNLLTTQIDNLFERLRTSDELAFLSEQFYPEWRTLMSSMPGEPAPHTAATWELPKDERNLRHGFYFCNSLIQLMENVYLDLGLESQWVHPDNSGWINVFRHWTWSPMFRVTWAIAASTYGRRFREFCRQRLGLELGDVAATPVYAGTPKSTGELEQVLEAKRLNLVERDQIGRLVGQYRPGLELRIYRLDLQLERTASEPSAPLSERLLRCFAFGYALVVGSELVMYRVQDHVRSMELGRRGLVELVRADPEGAGLRLPADVAQLLRAIGEPVRPELIAEFGTALESTQLALAV